MRLRTEWLAVLVILALAGCGYRPVGSAPRSGDAPRPSLAIPPFANLTTEVGLETILANAMVQTFSESKTVRVTTLPESADLVLEGKVVSIENTSVAYFDITRSLVRRVTMRVDYQLKRGSTGKVVWKNSEIIQEDYTVNPNYHIGEATKAEGLRRAAYTLARRVMDKVLLVM